MEAASTWGMDWMAMGHRFNRQFLKIMELASHPVVQLGAAGVFSLLVYGLFLVRPVFLYDYYHIPHLDGDYAVWADPGFRRRTIAAFITLGALYLFAWRAARRARGRAAWGVVLGGWLAFSLLLTFLMPFDAADIFDNIVHGRILGLYGENPFIRVGADFLEDPFVPYMAWGKSPSAYGPLWELLAAPAARLAARLAGDSAPVNIIFFKWLGGLFYAAALGIAAALLRRKAPDRALAGVLLLAWNPVALYETLGNGHNDMAMVVWILGAAWALAERRYTLALLSLVLGALVKYIPVLLAPAAFFIALRALPRPKERLGFTLRSGLLCAGLAALAYAPFWEGLRTLSIERRAGMFSASLPSALFHALRPEIGEGLAALLVGGGAALLTLLFALWQGWAAVKPPARQAAGEVSPDEGWLAFSRAGFNILMFYLLFTCLWFQQWYTLWPLGLAALLPAGASTHLAVLFGFAALSKQFIIGPVLFRLKPPPRQPWFELQFIAGIMLVPWLYALYLWQRARRQPQRRRVAKNSLLKSRR